jgi:hypothetical protein
MIKYLISSLILLSLITSCEKNIQIDLDYEDKLVVNAFLNDDNGIELKLTKSLNPQGEYPKPLNNFINDATVELYENKNLIAVLQNNGEGIYNLSDANEDFIPTAGNQYQIKIYHNKYPGVESNEITYPEKPVVSEFLNYLDTTFKMFGNLNQIFEFKLQFEENKTSYFNYKVLKDDEPLYYFADVSQNNLQINKPCYFTQNNNSFLSTQCLQNNSFIKYYFDYIYNDDSDYQFIIRSINQDFFKYLANNPSDQFDNTVIDAFMAGSNKKPNYFNIKNGYGIFYASRTTIINFKTN